MGMACSTHGEMRNLCKIFDRKPERKKLHRRPRRRSEDNIKVGLIETGFEVCELDSTDSG
jgi:hypothetical protein